jgi:hypothetical protein
VRGGKVVLADGPPTVPSPSGRGRPLGATDRLDLGKLGQVEELPRRFDDFLEVLQRRAVLRHGRIVRPELVAGDLAIGRLGVKDFQILPHRLVDGHFARDDRGVVLEVGDVAEIIDVQLAAGIDVEQVENAVDEPGTIVGEEAADMVAAHVHAQVPLAVFEGQGQVLNLLRRQDDAQVEERHAEPVRVHLGLHTAVAGVHLAAKEVEAVLAHTQALVADAGQDGRNFHLKLRVDA